MSSPRGMIPHGDTLVSASTDTQERWRRFYETAAQNSAAKAPPPDPIREAESRAFWQTCFMICSTVFVGGLMTFFYTVLQAH